MEVPERRRPRRLGRRARDNAWTVETVMLPSDAAARLKKGSCKMMTLPMRPSAEVLVGMAGNIRRRQAGTPRKSVSAGLNLSF